MSHNGAVMPRRDDVDEPLPLIGSRHGGRIDLAGIRPVRITPGEVRGPNGVPGMVERVVYVGSTTQIHVRLPGGEAVQSLTANAGDIPDWPAGTPVGVTLPADALRALPT